LLKRIARGRDGEDCVCPVVAAAPKKSRAGIFREHLQAANVEAPFYEDTPTHLAIDFRSLRDSGITWRFLAEHRAEVVQREAGHEHISTTLGYAKEVQDRRGRYGEPFPALPGDLTEEEPPPGPVPTPTVYTVKNIGQMGRGGGICGNPFFRAAFHERSAENPGEPAGPRTTAQREGPGCDGAGGNWEATKTSARLVGAASPDQILPCNASRRSAAT
jgi:hypothetical protein